MDMPTAPPRLKGQYIQQDITGRINIKWIPEGEPIPDGFLPLPMAPPSKSLMPFGYVLNERGVAVPIITLKPGELHAWHPDSAWSKWCRRNRS